MRSLLYEKEGCKYEKQFLFLSRSKAAHGVRPAVKLYDKPVENMHTYMQAAIDTEKVTLLTAVNLINVQHPLHKPV